MKRLLVLILLLTLAACARGAAGLSEEDAAICLDEACLDTPGTPPAQQGPDAAVTPDTPREDNGQACTDLWYPDSDGDGHGDAGSVGIQACTAPNRHAATATDCDDANPGVNPNAQEIPGDGVDQNCDGTESCYADADGDGRRAAQPTLVPAPGLNCDAPGMVGADAPADDCNDANPNIHGGAEEVCDGIDNNCDGQPELQADCPCSALQNDGSTYLFCDATRQWTEARFLCQDYGSALVIVDTSLEDTFLTNQMANRGYNTIWLGASDGANEGVWQWVDGTGLSYTGWRGDEPNNEGNGNGNDADCAAKVIGNNPGWADRSCADEYAFVCETPQR